MQATLRLPISADTRSRLLQGWAFAQRELIHLAWALMEASLLLPFSMAIMRWTRYWPPNTLFIWILALMLLPFNLARLLSALRIPGARQQWIMGGGLLITVLYTLRTLIYPPAPFYDFSWMGTFYDNLAQTRNILWLRDISLFLLVTVLWWRGLRLSQRHYSVNSIGLRLRLGGLLIAPIVIWLGTTRLQWDISPYLLLFFLAGLTGLSMIRAEELEQNRSGQSTSLGPRWLMMIFLASFLCIFTATILTIIISGESAFLIGGWLAPLWLALSFGGTVMIAALTYVALPFLLVIGAIIEFLGNLLAVIMRANPFSGQEVTATPAPGAVVTLTPEPGLLTTFTLNTVPKVAIIALMLLLVTLVTLALGRLYQQANLAELEGGGINGRSDDQIKPPGPARRLLERLGLLRNWRAAASIRRVYKQMVKTAAAVGYPRLDAETPYEYLRTLALAWPNHPAEIRLITDAFVRIRYGEVPETKAELNAILQAWDLLEETRPLHAPETNSST